MFKNEAKWLPEWLDYHRNVLSVHHFYLYNNESSDDYAQVLQPYIEDGIVELFDWGSDDPKHLAYGAFMDAPWSAAQLGAYNDCLKKKALGKSDWVAMIDIDEFIVPVKGVDSFYSLLTRAAKKGKGTVSLVWRVFGTSDVEELKEGELLTEKLVWRGADCHRWHDRVKSIHRPEGVAFCFVHFADKMEPGFGSKTLDPEVARIHHYWARTENFCKQRRKNSKDLSPVFFDELHAVEDRTICQYLPLLKEKNSR